MKHRTEAAPEQVRVAALVALQRQSHIYAGTVPDGVVQRRRAANRVAKASRRANRHGR